MIPIIDNIKRFYGQGGEHFWAYYLDYWGNIFGNVVLFMPFGFLLSWLYVKQRWQLIMLYGFFTSIIIELTQYILQIGVCDIDDVILNVTGTAIGIFLYKKFVLVENK